MKGGKIDREPCLLTPKVVAIAITYNWLIHQGSDKGGEVVQWHLVGTKRNA